MSRFIAFAFLLCGTTSIASAQDFAQLENTYHVEVRVEHWRIGSAYWSTEFSTTDYDSALLMFDLFELALEENALREMLGFSWQWLVTDVRIRTEYPPELTAPLQRAQTLRLQRQATAYQTPIHQYPGQ